MSQQNLHEIIKYNSLCYVSESRPFNNNLLINGVENHLQGYTGIENWVDFYLTSENKEIRIDGFGYDDEVEKLYLVYSNFFQGEFGEFVTSDEVSNGIKHLSNFVASLVNNTLFEEIDESEQSVMTVLQDLKHRLEKCELKLLYLTNVTAPPIVEINLEEINEQFEIFDFSKMYQFHISSEDAENIINIDLLSMNSNVGLPILMATEPSQTLEGYLLNMPGRMLAEIYEKYKVSLLESNIRFYLQDKANTNKGILRTIRGDVKNGLLAEPERFFSYNNGISATCSGIEIGQDGKLIKIVGLQIVNGGQTTASIHQILNSEYDSFLDQVTVQMKLSLIKCQEGKDEIISKIAEYANTQNPIKKSDLTSNNNFIIDLEHLSKRTAPKINILGQISPKWFFERKVGEYNSLQINAKKKGKFDAFIAEFPKSQVINKTDFAKRAWAWGVTNKKGKNEVLPYVASKSAEIVYRKYIDTMESNGTVVNTDFFKESIAKEIIYKKIYSLLSKLGVSGYKSNVALYTMSWLSYKIQQKIDLIMIWDKQDISVQLHDLISEMIPKVHDVILTPNDKKSEHYGKNIGEFTKKEECWGLLKKKSIVISDNIPELTRESVETAAIDGVQSTSIYETREFWVKMTVWSALLDNVWNDRERGMIHSVASYIKLGKQLSAKQKKFRDHILEKALSEGFNFEDN
jgi:hypothetical protein